MGWALPLLSPLTKSNKTSSPLNAYIKCTACRWNPSVHNKLTTVIPQFVWDGAAVGKIELTHGFYLLLWVTDDGAVFQSRIWYLAFFPEIYSHNCPISFMCHDGRVSCLSMSGLMTKMLLLQGKLGSYFMQILLDNFVNIIRVEIHTRHATAEQPFVAEHRNCRGGSRGWGRVRWFLNMDRILTEQDGMSFHREWNGCRVCSIIDCGYISQPPLILWFLLLLVLNTHGRVVFIVLIRITDTMIDCE